jgi:hypothetical protein
MTCTCESPLAVTLKGLLSSRLREHSWSLLELAQEMAQEFECPVCEILTPLGEALSELVAAHSIRFDDREKQIMLA